MVALGASVALSLGASKAEGWIVLMSAVTVFAVLVESLGFVDPTLRNGAPASLPLVATVLALTLTFAAGISGYITAIGLFAVVLVVQLRGEPRTPRSGTSAI